MKYVRVLWGQCLHPPSPPKKVTSRLDSQISESCIYFLPAAKRAGQGMLKVVLLIVVVGGGNILAYPCAFKKGVFREVFYLAHVLSKNVCSEGCVQRGVFTEPWTLFHQNKKIVAPNQPPQVIEQILFLFPKVQWPPIFLLLLLPFSVGQLGSNIF